MFIGEDAHRLAELAGLMPASARALTGTGATEPPSARFTPDLPVLLHHGPNRHRGAAFRSQADGQHLVVTSYGTMHRDRDLLGTVPWRAAILDEAQNIKNPASQQARTAQGLRADYRIALKRNGTRNLFMCCEPLAGWRHVAVTERRTMQDFARRMRWLADEAYPEAEVVRVVLDNLNTHRRASLYETFPALRAIFQPSMPRSPSHPTEYPQGISAARIVNVTPRLHRARDEAVRPAGGRVGRGALPARD